MWKKFLSLAVVLGVLTTTTGMSAVALEIERPTIPSGPIIPRLGITNLEVDPLSFNPSEGEVTTVSFTLLRDADIHAYALDEDNRRFNIHGSRTFPFPETAGEVSYTWTGKTFAGDPLDDGLYTVAVVAYRDGNYLDSKVVEDVEITSTPEPVPPTVSYFTVNPFRFSPDQNERTNISFRVDQDSHVTVVVKRGSSVVRTFSAYADRWTRGGVYHSFSWYGTDNFGRVVPEGVYWVEVTARVGDLEGRTYRRYVIVEYAEEEEEEEKPLKGCGGYWDTKHLNDDELCRAIEWVTEAGVFHGYADGSFGHDRNINRAEVLKVLLEAFEDVDILPSSPHNYGFWDLNPHAWYIPYVRTAVHYDILHGYPDGSARLSNSINRVEFLKLALEASERFTWFTIPTYHYSYYMDVDYRKRPWYLNYAGLAHDYELFDYITRYTGGPKYLKPGDLVKRGEVAKLLYRMHLYGLL